ncbi:uncharacterized protein PHALS_10992 [Plasmopara halstedii]|uniref:Uncharacterized protein n=1 Tax=Plasmopara halstedii TaxID=4781 RepID=A0A0N7L590_PLAHL|nr:uncharacterized protein PHALS_10992 [Plasmopara halstedii]CEG40811.1 hypothetical protein PHALS_10992 [Plasmopara halstedii]|eukprot:XP_024577180.1 hypothetical protein PHALS_10992 [Plasmopara halstedii]
MRDELHDRIFHLEGVSQYKRYDRFETSTTGEENPHELLRLLRPNDFHQEPKYVFFADVAP